MIRAEPIKARPKKRFDLADQVKKLGADSLLPPQKRAPYRGGTSIEATKPWLKEDPPMGRRTWYRRRKEKEQGK